MEKLPYDHKYELSLSIGYLQAIQKGTVNPSEYGEYSEEEWNELSLNEQEDWLCESAQEWAETFIDISWEK